MTATAKNTGLTQAARGRVSKFINEHFVEFSGSIKNPLDLKKASNKKNNDPRPSEDSIVANLPTFEEYIKSRKSPVVYGNMDVVLLFKKAREEYGHNNPCYRETKVPGISSFKCEFAFIDPKSKLVYIQDTLPYHSINEDLMKSILTDNEIDFDEDLFTTYRPSSTGTYPAMLCDNLLILNADEEATDEYNLIGNEAFKNFPAISFECMANLLANKVVPYTSRNRILDNNEVEIVAFCPEEKAKLSPELSKEASVANQKGTSIFRNWANSIKPPKPGFTIIPNNETGRGYIWHKSPTVLFRDKKRSYIVGQDEGTYFGCILANHPKTIEEAYLSLMPAAAIGIKGVLRQGEWFAIPVDAKNVPKPTSENTCLWTDEAQELRLPIEDDSSNVHQFNDGEIVFTKDGKFFAKDFTISHEEHAELRGNRNQWYTFARNTALASYSGEKVD